MTGNGLVGAFRRGANGGRSSGRDSFDGGLLQGLQEGRNVAGTDLGCAAGELVLESRRDGAGRPGMGQCVLTSCQVACGCWPGRDLILCSRLHLRRAGYDKHCILAHGPSTSSRLLYLQVAARMKQYEDELARKRMMAEHELQRQRMAENVKLQVGMLGWEGLGLYGTRVR